VSKVNRLLGGIAGSTRPSQVCTIIRVILSIVTGFEMTFKFQWFGWTPGRQPPPPSHGSTNSSEPALLAILDLFLSKQTFFHRQYSIGTMVAGCRSGCVNLISALVTLFPGAYFGLSLRSRVESIHPHPKQTPPVPRGGAGRL
jgi:hypothetical protein